MNETAIGLTIRLGVAAAAAALMTCSASEVNVGDNRGGPPGHGAGGGAGAAGSGVGGIGAGADGGIGVGGSANGGAGGDSGGGNGGGSGGDAGLITPPDAGGTQIEWSYLWVANSGEGTLSKVDTLTLTEVGRYKTRADGQGDPSRTSVNLAGDMVVTNRQPQKPPSSVTKFAARPGHCIDRNGNGKIDTSTGGGDVKPWGEDECMIWHTEVPGNLIGARGTAWDGKEDPKTGKGGHVWVGTYQQYFNPKAQEYVYEFDGDTGAIINTIKMPMTPSPCGSYGGAQDATGGYWIANNSTTGHQAIARVDQVALTVDVIPVPGAYGITVDGEGRVWTTAGNTVVRYTPGTGKTDTAAPAAGNGGVFLRGIAAGFLKAKGYMWVAESFKGGVSQVDKETMKEVKFVPLPATETIGVAIDFEGYVWVISSTSGTAYRVDPETYDVKSVKIGNSPYTYSDMTGGQLKNAVNPY